MYLETAALNLSGEVNPLQYWIVRHKYFRDPKPSKPISIASWSVNIYIFLPSALALRFRYIKILPSTITE